VEQAKLSPQARRNLRITTEPLRVQTYPRTIEIPGTIVDRPGVSDRKVVSPVTGVLTSIHHYAGDVVVPGQTLFTMRLVGDGLQTSQIELFKASQEDVIIQEKITRLKPVSTSGAIAESRMIELRNDLRRTAITIRAHRQDLQIRGLTVAQIDAVARGNFVSEITLPVPLAGNNTPQPTTGPTSQASPLPVPSGEATAGTPTVGSSPVYEVQELHAQLGQQIQAGQTLCTLSNHQSLFVEGRAFRSEIPLVQRAIEHNLPIEFQLLEEADHDWRTPISPAVIHNLANELNDDKRTVSFYLPLQNQFRTYQRAGKTLYLWRFRPGQRVRLQVQVEMLENVFVLPSAAVVNEGAERYVFRRNGDLYERKPVHVRYETREKVVIDNDGSVSPGVHIVQRGAAQLNRALKSQSSSPSTGVHVHADGSVHADH